MNIEVDQDLLKNKKVTLFVKRIFDIAASISGLIILIPVFLVVALVITIDSKGGILFKQIRIGRWQKEFKIYKFRTMIVNQRQGSDITVGADSRITRAGNFLRKTKLDELPQLINVLLGQMSLVGPRPEIPKYIQYYTAEEMKVFCIRPGITERASLYYVNESELLAEYPDPESAYINIIMHDKLRINLDYIKNLSLLNDIKLILSTIKKLM